jgi:hypothetical protein
VQVIYQKKAADCRAKTVADSSDKEASFPVKRAVVNQTENVRSSFKKMRLGDEHAVSSSVNGVLVGAEGTAWGVKKGLWVRSKMPKHHTDRMVE